MIVLLLAATIQQMPPPRPPQQHDDVIVTTRAETPEERGRRLVDSVTPRFDRRQPVARFTTPLCIGVSGVAGELATPLADRMRHDAAGVGLAVVPRGEPCVANVVVMFVDDSKAAFEDLIRRGHRLLGDMLPADSRRLADDPEPAKAWSVTAMRKRDGEPQEPDGPVRIWAASNIVLPARRDVTGSFVMIDRDAAVGRTVGQLAGYALMRAATIARPLPATTGETILSLFAPDGTPPPAMTDFDRSYVRGYYQGPGYLPRATQVGRIAASVAREDRAAPPGQGTTSPD